MCKSAKQSKRRSDQTHTKAPEHPSRDLEITIGKRCKSGKSCKRQKCKKWQKLQNVAEVQDKAKDSKPSAYKASRTPFSRFGDNDWQTLQMFQREQK